jgi:hypothetical protein
MNTLQSEKGIKQQTWDAMYKPRILNLKQKTTEELIIVSHSGYKKNPLILRRHTLKSWVVTVMIYATYSSD